ncbi:unnamed protein product [Aphis gossypii]|uniref:Uncharacterized protein n=1 Tax=Aphis gossypii TaxID=80765 RepID=A0A9P0JGL4_APHGO|nr:unnamed protein product [Aphis gossypii]
MSRRRAHATHRWPCDVGGDGGCINCGTVDGTRTNDAAGAATDDDHDDDGDSDRCVDSDDDDGRGDGRDDDDNDSDDGDDDDDDDDNSDGDREFTGDDHRPARAIAKAAFDDAIPAPRRPGHHIVVSSSTIRSRCYGFGSV